MGDWARLNKACHGPAPSAAAGLLDDVGCWVMLGYVSGLGVRDKWIHVHRIRLML